MFPSQGPESFSRVLLEAGALGVPVAAMDTGGTRDIILPGRTGLLSSDAASLAADMARIAADPELARSLGEAARRHVDEHFSAGKVVARIEAVYQEAVARHA